VSKEYGVRSEGVKLEVSSFKFEERSERVLPPYPLPLIPDYSSLITDYDLRVTNYEMRGEEV